MSNKKTNKYERNQTIKKKNKQIPKKQKDKWNKQVKKTVPNPKKENLPTKSKRKTKPIQYLNNIKKKL